MLAKLTSKNQLTLPKSVTDRLGPVQYFDVQLQAGQVLLTPVRIQRGDAVRAKLAELDLDDALLDAAIDWAQPPSKTAKPAAATKRVVAATVKPVDKAAAKVVTKPAAKSAVNAVSKPSSKAAAKALAKTAAGTSAKTSVKKAHTPADAAKPARARRAAA